MDLLKVENVSKHYAGHTALDDVSLTIPKGSIYGLLGPNGAGKTTLIRIINRITAPDSGKVYFGDREIKPEDIYRIGYLPEERGLYKNMKVGEQAIFFAQLKGLSRREAIARLKVWFIRFGIEQWWNKKISELSKGMAQKVQFITTILHKPELLIFDEPFSGFDPINVQLLKNEILELRNQGSTVIFSTHNMSSVEEICEHITLISKSKNILSGKVDDIRRQHGSNTFEIAYKGDVTSVRSAIEGKAEILDGSEASALYSTLKLQIVSDHGVRSVISAINEAVELRSFNEVIPSMNDIFIKAVSGKL